MHNSESAGSYGSFQNWTLVTLRSLGMALIWPLCLFQIYSECDTLIQIDFVFSVQ